MKLPVMSCSILEMLLRIVLRIVLLCLCSTDAVFRHARTMILILLRLGLVSHIPIVLQFIDNENSLR
jgi:EamA domain-containing membrane protein RarD